MAKDYHLPPHASSLAYSLRDLGYSLETAVADLIDNSISAHSDLIEIFCETSAIEPVLVVLDNGCGMTGDELLVAMRHGSISPQEKRAPSDLGRFGLGLKTASFSQCRSLTVVSSKNGELHGAEWDLDLIEKNNDWTLRILEKQDITLLPYVERLGPNGTAIIWRKLDRMLENESGKKRDEIVNEKLDTLDKHLSLVFHRFLAGELKERKKITIKINGHIVEPFDPFCRRNKYTRKLPEEVVHIGSEGEAVRLQPYILPHHSNLSSTEYHFYQNRSDFISNQGAYIYRNGRLMAWGDWFRLIPKGEKTKLARVQIDFPNSLDELWTIDIKKSRSRPPLQVRERLKQIIDQVFGASTSVYRGRGQKLFQEIQAPIWERYEGRAGKWYAINSSHPLITRLKAKLDSDSDGVRHLDLFLEAVSASLPIEMIYSDYSASPRDVSRERSMQDIKIQLNDLKQAIWGNEAGDADTFRDVVRSTRLFVGYDEVVEKYINGEWI